MTTAADSIFVPGDAAASEATTAAETVCSHCGQVVPAGLVVRGAGEQFCCAGCRGVYETLHACGLDAYYRMREAAEVTSRPVKGGDSTFESFDSTAFEELYVQRRDEHTATVDLVLEGVQCAACVWLVERLPRVLEGVVEARLSLRERVVRVTWDTRTVKLSRVARTLEGIGYVPHPARGQSGKALHRKESRKRLVHLGIAGALMGNTMLLGLALYAGDAAGGMEGRYTTFFRWLSAVLGVVSLAWPGATFFTSAWAAIRMRAVNLDVPIALALLVGGVAGMTNVVLGRGEIYFDSLTVLVFLLLVGRFIQYQQQRRADDAVGLLFSLTPSSCRIVRADGVVVDAPIEALKVGDLVEVRAGDLLPADGTVEQGRSSVNQALLTGESMPVTVEAGDEVCAGAQNVASVVRVRVTKVGRETRVGQLMGLIERGVQEKPRIVQFADKVGSVFLVVLTIVAAGTFAFWSVHANITAAIDHTVALLIVTCPCVLGLATPLTIAIAIGRMARRDILIKSGAVLEKLAKGGELLLDKTGTLTEGRLQLLKWVGDEGLRPVVAEMERDSAHPVGRALAEGQWSVVRGPLSEVVESGDGGISATYKGKAVRAGSPRYMATHGVNVPEPLARAAMGFERGGATAVMVADGGEVVAVAGLGDKVREDSRGAVGRLRAVGFVPAVLSGDAKDVVRQVAHLVGIEPGRAQGEVSPEEKLARVRGAAGADAGRGYSVMVGDGVNDAAALAAADVGIAVHGGAEASLAAADVYVARPGLTPLVELATMSLRTMRTIRRNLVVSLGYNLLAGVLAVTGVMTPLIAAIIMPVSSATVLSLAAMSIGRGGQFGVKGRTEEKGVR